MAESLSYAAPMPWYRRRRWLFLLTFLLLLVGYLLALPQYRILRQHQIRRTEIRRQFKVEVATARRALHAGDLDAAGLSLLNAEFPIRTEAELFWRSEVDRCKAELTPLRARLIELSATIHAEAERKAAEAKERLAREREEDERREVHTDYFLPCGDVRTNVVATLVLRATEQLRKHNNQNALQICRQIVTLDPEHTFDDAFWATAQPRP